MKFKKNHYLFITWHVIPSPLKCLLLMHINSDLKINEVQSHCVNQVVILPLLPNVIILVKINVVQSYVSKFVPTKWNGFHFVRWNFENFDQIFNEYNLRNHNWSNVQLWFLKSYPEILKIHFFNWNPLHFVRVSNTKTRIFNLFSIFRKKITSNFGNYFSLVKVHCTTKERGENATNTEIDGFIKFLKIFFKILAWILKTLPLYTPPLICIELLIHSTRIRKNTRFILHYLN